jgi:hypothetical protein
VFNLVSQLVQTLAEGVVVAIVVVVTHLGFLVGAAVTLTFNSLFGDLHFLANSRTWDGCVNGELVGVDLRAELGGRSGVGRGAVGAESLAVVTLSDVNGAQVGTTVGVDFNVSLGVLGSRLRAEAVLFAVVLLVLETGTAAMFFFTCNKNLFLAVTVVCTGRNLSSVGSERRVSLFPSGWLLLGKFDVNLLVSGCCGGGGGLCFAVPISGREDAEGNGDSGLKVQIDDFCCRERIFSYNLP